MEYLGFGLEPTSPKEKYLRGTYMFNRNSFMMGGEPLVFHSNHYNAFFIHAVESVVDNDKFWDFLGKPAAEIAYSQFTNYFTDRHFDLEERKDIVTQFYKYCGYGLIDFSELGEDGGTVKVMAEHFSTAYRDKYGVRDPEKGTMAHFAQGFLTGVICVLFDKKPGYYKLSQTECILQGADACTFEVKVVNQTDTYDPSPAGGKLDKYHELVNPDGTSVDYLHIRKSLISHNYFYSDSQGQITGFNVKLTRMYANYYVSVASKVVRFLEANSQHEALAKFEALLIQAGEISSFYTFGGVTLSESWNELLDGMLKTPEDWLHGLLAFINTFGWGFYEVAQLIPGEKLVVNVRSGYEANAYLGKYGYNDRPASYLAVGVLAGVMNLVYNGKIYERPVFDEALYNKAYNGPNKFIGRQLQARTMGDKVDEVAIVAY